MQLKKDYKNVVCVYKITCKPNGKILIGSTTNLYSRINHYRNDVNKDNPLKHYNKAFYDDLIKYGITCFIVDIVEQFDDISAIELKNKETYYMNLFNSLDSDVGYNIRQDVNGKYICADSTKETKRLREAGIIKTPRDLGIDISRANRSMLAAQNVHDLVVWSKGLYNPPAKFRNW